MKYEFVKPMLRCRIAPLCPCGRNNLDGKFVPFLINGQGQEKLGHCFSCGDTFQPDCSNVPTHIGERITFEIKPKPELQYISSEEVNATLKGYRTNNFALWLKGIFHEQVSQLLNYFSIGTCRKGGTLFWYRDIKGNYRKLKRIFYKSDGHRYKPEDDIYKSQCSPLHYKNDKGYEYCLYGEFQLSLYPEETPIFLVESEKTVVLCYAVFPQYIWLATGGANKMKPDQAKVLAKRKVYIIPDLHQIGREGAQRTKKVLEESNCSASINDIAPSVETGEDIADLLIC